MGKRSYWNRPKTFYDTYVKVTDPASDLYGQIGQVFDVCGVGDTTEYLVYFPVLKTRGYVQCFHHSQVVKVPKQ